MSLGVAPADALALKGQFGDDSGQHLGVNLALVGIDSAGICFRRHIAIAMTKSPNQETCSEFGTCS